MLRLGDKVPEYLLEKYQMIVTLVFTVLFSLVFVLLTLPFSGNVWFNIQPLVTLQYLLIFIALSLAIMLISRHIMYKYKTGLDLSYLGLILWGFAEAVLISGLYSTVTYYAARSGIIDLGNRQPLHTFLGTLTSSVVALGVPQVIAAMAFTLRERNNTIRLLNYANVVTDESYLPDSGKKITLYDNNGLMKLSVSASHLYYIESDDNYIKVWYEDNGGTLKQYMLRCKLKTVEESFAESDLVRCHRKYIVNLAHVNVLSRLKDGYELSLNVDGLDPIPVSKTYEAKVLARFNSRRN